jgi:hypothetical protein
MKNARQDNGMIVSGTHNGGITRPKILFCVGKRKVVDEGLESFKGRPIQIFGSKRLVKADYREFTSAHVTPGTSDHKEYEASVSEEDRSTLQALTLLRAAYSRPAGDPIAEQALMDATNALVPGYPKSGPKEGDLKAFYKGKDLREIANRHYHTLLNQELKHACLWIPLSTVVPLVLCPNIKTAAFVYHAYRGVSACLNCRKQFATDFRHADGSKSPLYCSTRCGQQYRQKLYRHGVNKMLSEARAKKGGN